VRHGAACFSTSSLFAAFLAFSFFELAYRCRLSRLGFFPNIFLLALLLHALAFFFFFFFLCLCRRQFFEHIYQAGM
jgi:hypothetical protein